MSQTHNADRFEAQIRHWQQNARQFSLPDWQTFLASCNPIPFAPDYIEVEAEFWGMFWQGDVIAPGYTMPVLELSFLRAWTRSEDLPFKDEHGFLRHLQTLLLQSPLSLWLTRFGRRGLLAAVYPGWTLWLGAGQIQCAYPHPAAAGLWAPGYGLQVLYRRPIEPLEDPEPVPIEAGFNELELTNWAVEWGDWPFVLQQHRFLELQRVYHLANDERLQRRVARFLRQAAEKSRQRD